MANLQFVDFVIMPAPVRKEKQFRLPNDFSKIDVTTLSQTSHPTSCFTAVSQFVTTRTDCSQTFYTTSEKQEISTFPLSEVEFVAH